MIEKQLNYRWLKTLGVDSHFFFEKIEHRTLNTLRRSANARNVSFRISLRWLTYIVNSVDKTKLSCNTPTDAAPQFP